MSIGLSLIIDWIESILLSFCSILSWLPEIIINGNIVAIFFKKFQVWKIVSGFNSSFDSNKSPHKHTIQLGSNILIYTKSL